MTPKLLVGIDEAGRGPLAGPLSVCALWAEPEIAEQFRGVGDSKQLSPKKRELFFAQIFLERTAGRAKKSRSRLSGCSTTWV